MAEIVAGVGTSHVPAIGAAVDHGLTGNDYWKPLFDGYEPARDWLRETEPDVAVIVYNDHASAFSLELIPTFGIGVAEEFLPADEGFGPRAVPVVQGHAEFAWHLAEQLSDTSLSVLEELGQLRACEEAGHIPIVAQSPPGSTPHWVRCPPAMRR